MTQSREFDFDFVHMIRTLKESGTTLRSLIDGMRNRKKIPRDSAIVAEKLADCCPQGKDSRAVLHCSRQQQGHGNDRVWKAWKAGKNWLPTLPTLYRNPFGFPHSQGFDDGYLLFETQKRTPHGGSGTVALTGGGIKGHLQTLR